MRLVGALLIWFFGMGILAVTAQDIRKSMTLQDLVGEWELVFDDKSTRGNERLESGLIRITIKDSEVTIFRRLEDKRGTTERIFTYFADGRGETNRWIGEDRETVIEQKTKTSWKRGILTSRWSYKANLGWFDVEDMYRLSKDLLTLEYERLHQGARPLMRSFSTRMIFRRL